MTKDKTTEASKVELSDEQLDGAKGGAGYLKLNDIDGESQGQKGGSLKFGKVQAEYFKGVDGIDKPSTRLKR